MSSTTYFANACIGFQNARLAAQKEYQDRATAIADAKGTKYYDDEIKKASDKRDAALRDAAATYEPKMRESLGWMRRANARRTLTPPTQEMVNALTVLQMKETVSENDLQTAANLCSGCGLALDVINEMARTKGKLPGSKEVGIMRVFGNKGDEISIDTAALMIDGLEREADDFLKHDSKRAARIAADRNQRMYGTEPGELPKRDTFSDEAGCFAELANLSGDDLTAFQDAVN